MIAARNHFRREPYPPNGGPRAAVALCHAAGRRVRARRQKRLLGRFGRRLAYDAQAGAWGGCGVVTCGRRPIRMANEKTRGGFLRAGLTIFAMMDLCR